ncbi:hypothetical protein SYN60AY4M2_11490 [Synechococcus sp. 60AY4M2]|nr:hypothetical protein SYN65AY6A5_01135 [Synechococcus sp. 65AY6A5]PIK96519.1 hypothetical protein SYN60AY4M2_11490 [Synechococcus sp. 60AY4M2]PIK99121.1 hypothetical protein SYN63AY4M1_08920 [Synechococcus sp. 63AY4M1]PIL02437.1 hypothetical protein SYN65AY640_05170 [Synechococcus sp. 65AY640]
MPGQPHEERPWLLFPARVGGSEAKRFKDENNSQQLDSVLRIPYHCPRAKFLNKNLNKLGLDKDQKAGIWENSPAFRGGTFKCFLG